MPRLHLLEGSRRVSNSPEQPSELGSEGPAETIEFAERAGFAVRTSTWLRRHALSTLLVLVPSCAAGAYLSDELLDGSLPRGLNAFGLDLSHASVSDAQQRLGAKLQKRLATPLRVALGGKSVTLVPAEAGLGFDVSRSLARAVAERRDRGVGVRFTSWVQSVLGNLPPATLVAHDDAAKLELKLDEIEQRVLEAPFTGGFHLEAGRIVPEYPRGGSVIDRPAALEQLRAAVLGATPEVSFRTKTVPPPVERGAIDRLVDRARHLSDADITLAEPNGSRRLVLHGAELAKALRVSPQPGTEPALVISGDALLAGLGDRRAALENAAKSAHFVVRPGDRVELVEAEPERRLAPESLARAVEAAAATSTRSAELPLERGAEPELTTAQAEALSIRGRVSSFTTRHPCCERRVENIHRIADLLDGLLVKPGETVSLNNVLGPRTAKNGFVPAPTIEEGEMVETVGGGISQFATTFFNALFYGGYDIIERQPHTYWFPRYPMGHEATLSYPKPDLIFRNDTQAGMLFHTEYTKTTITVSIYGDNGGRRVTAEVSERQNIVKPPIEIIPNAQVSPDKEHVLQGGMIGWTVTVGRIIRFPDGTKKEERRKVTYKPKVRRVEVHPCRVPEGEKGYTGERCPEPEDSGESESSG